MPALLFLNTDLKSVPPQGIGAMPSPIECPRCRRAYTVEEYEEDAFCRDCGSRLTVTAGEALLGSWRTVFPYEPYPQQVDFMTDVARVVGGGKVLIAEACNGFGKTVSALSCLLPLGRRIIYATRTHEQVRQVLLEME